jgi:hypothetical protein
MSVTPAPRRLLVVDPCDDCYALLPGLRAAGWEVDSCALESVGTAPATSACCVCSPTTLSAPKRSKS